MKKFVSLFLGFLSFFLLAGAFSPTPSFAAQAASCWITKVGNPQGPPPPLPQECLTVASGKLGDVLSWNKKINDALEQGLWNFYNRMEADISNGGYSAVKRTGVEQNTSSNGLYWCTDSIIDSYNLAGITGLKTGQHEAVVVMADFWRTTPGYIYLDYLTGNHQDVLTKLQPGYAMFMAADPNQTQGSEHVNMIKTKTIDGNGNGTLETYDSNSNGKVNKFPVDNWEVQGTPYPVFGFGGIPGDVSAPGQNTAIKDLVDSLPGTATAMIVLPGGEKVSRNSENQVPSASVIKLFVAAAAYNAAAQGKLNLNEQYTVQQSDVVGGTGDLQNNVGATFTYDAYIAIMLTKSDNVATNILINKLGGFGPINAYIQQAGYPNTKLQRMLGKPDPNNENLTSATDAANFFANLLGNRVVNDQYSQKIIKILEQRRTIENPSYIYIGRDLPQGVYYIEKSGTDTGVRNDAGVFHTKSGQPVIVSIFLSGLSNEATGEDAIAKAVQQMYNSLP